MSRQDIILTVFPNDKAFYDPQLLKQVQDLAIQLTQKLAKKYSAPLSKVIVHFNKRLRTTAGEYVNDMSNTLSGTCEFIFNTKYVLGCCYDVNNGGTQNLLPIIQHEALHYVAQFVGNGHNNDGDANFEQLLIENHAVSSAATGKNKRGANVQKVNYYYKNKALHKVIYN